MSEPLRFRVGQRVEKVGGDYAFAGLVVAAFAKRSGAARYVVEDDRGILMIYSAKNLRADETPPCVVCGKSEPPPRTADYGGHLRHSWCDGVNTGAAGEGVTMGSEIDRPGRDHPGVIFFFPNGNVAVFDGAGRQMSRYQRGSHMDAIRLLRADGVDWWEIPERHGSPMLPRFDPGEQIDIAGGIPSEEYVRRQRDEEG